MAKGKCLGFRYYLSDEMLEGYQKKPVALRLPWLYMANVLRMGYSKRTIELQDLFREGKICSGDKDVMQATRVRGMKL